MERRKTSNGQEMATLERRNAIVEKTITITPLALAVPTAGFLTVETESKTHVKPVTKDGGMPISPTTADPLVFFHSVETTSSTTWLVKLVMTGTTDLVMVVMLTAKLSVEMESWTETSSAMKEFTILTQRQTSAEPLAACLVVETVLLTSMKNATMVLPTLTPKRMLAELLAPFQSVVTVLLMLFTVKLVTTETPSMVMAAQALANQNAVMEKSRVKNNVITEPLTRTLFLMLAEQHASFQPVAMESVIPTNNATQARTLLNVKAVLSDVEMECWNPRKNATTAFITQTLNLMDVEPTASCLTVETVFWTPWKSVMMVF